MIRASLAPMTHGNNSVTVTCRRGTSSAVRHGALVDGVGGQPVQRFWRTGLAVAMFSWLAVVGVACSGCPGAIGKAEEVPVQIEWPDASTLGPVRSIDPTADPTASQTPPADDADGDQGYPPAESGPVRPVGKEAAADNNSPPPSPSPSL